MRVIPAILVLVALAVPAAADECVPSTSVTGPGQTVIEAPERNAAADYVAIDHCQPECLFSIWPYYENNGIPGLQRHDEVVDDTCGGLIDSDTWIQF